MTTIINALLSADTTAEVNEIINQNLDMLNENPRLWSFVKGARKRIHNMRRQKLFNTEIIYLN